jgi:tetratricopeptide (TPR) repeat protein
LCLWPIDTAFTSSAGRHGGDGRPAGDFRRGRALIRIRQFERAIADLDRVVAAEPRNAAAYFQRGLAQSNLGRYDLALADYDRAVEFDPSAETLNNRGRVHYERGQFAQALADYDRALAIDGKFVVALGNRGWALLRLGRRDEAERDFRAALALRPGFRPAEEGLKELGAAR